MNDLISRQAAINACIKVKELHAYDEIEEIKALPSVEAEIVKLGKWLIGVGENGEPIGTYCSECGWSWVKGVAAVNLNKALSLIKTPRCPYCGAIMERRKKNDRSIRSKANDNKKG